MVPMTSSVLMPSTLQIRPELYVIHLTPFIVPDNFTIEGHVSITLKVNQDASNITLHIKDITIYENMVTLRDVAQDDDDIVILGHAYDVEREFYIVKVDVKKDHEYVLSIGFQAELNDDLAGFYRSTYTVTTHNGSKVHYG